MTAQNQYSVSSPKSKHGLPSSPDNPQGLPVQTVLPPRKFNQEEFAQAHLWLARLCISRAAAQKGGGK